MLFRDYEPKALIQLARVRDLAERVRVQFAAGAAPDRILSEIEPLVAAYQSLTQLLPTGVSSGALARHLHFLAYYLKQEQPEACRDDIADICRVDLPKLEKALQARIADAEPYDAEFAEKIGPLLRDQHLDSAIRRAFVILKERLVRSFNLAPDLDGADLVNAVFGAKGALKGCLPESERQALRDLLAGMYGVFRNRYGHQDIEPAWSEAAAVLGMVNWTLQAIDRCAGNCTSDTTP